jgi:hypothetical protein
MEFLKDKKFLIAGLVLAGVVVAVLYAKKKQKDLTTATTNLETATEPMAKDNFTVSLGSTDPTGAVFLILGGKSHPFLSEKAFTNYGYTVPTIITKSELETYPSGGFVNEEGKVIQMSK